MTINIRNEQGDVSKKDKSRPSLTILVIFSSPSPKKPENIGGSMTIVEICAINYATNKFHKWIKKFLLPSQIASKSIWTLRRVNDTTSRLEK